MTRDAKKQRRSGVLPIVIVQDTGTRVFEIRQLATPGGEKFHVVEYTVPKKPTSLCGLGGAVLFWYGPGPEASNRARWCGTCVRRLPAGWPGLEDGALPGRSEAKPGRVPHKTEKRPVVESTSAEEGAGVKGDEPASAPGGVSEPGGGHVAPPEPDDFLYVVVHCPACGPGQQGFFNRTGDGRAVLQCACGQIVAEDKP